MKMKNVLHFDIIFNLDFTCCIRKMNDMKTEIFQKCLLLKNIFTKIRNNSYMRQKQPSFSGTTIHIKQFKKN